MPHDDGSSFVDTELAASEKTYLEPIPSICSERVSPSIHSTKLGIYNPEFLSCCNHFLIWIHDKKTSEEKKQRTYEETLTEAATRSKVPFGSYDCALFVAHFFLNSVLLFHAYRLF